MLDISIFATNSDIIFKYGTFILPLFVYDFSLFNIQLFQFKVSFKDTINVDKINVADLQE